MIKLLDLLKEDNPFVPRGSKEEREKDYNRITQNKIQEYIKNGMEGDLDLAFTSITSLPSNLTKVGGYLDLFNITSISSLPSNLTKVEGNLRLSHTKIASLPDNLTVKGNLNLFDTPITSLPDNLTVGGNIYLQQNSITSLPHNLTVGGYLDLRYTPLSKKYSEDEIRAMVPNIEGEIYI